MCAAIMAVFILETDHCHSVLVQPISVGIVEAGEKSVSSKWFAAMISEVIGSFFFCFLFMLSTDKST